MSARPRKRPVRVHNGHPRLAFKAKAVEAVVHELDRNFRVPAADEPFLSRMEILPKTDESPVKAGELSIAFLTDTSLAQIHGSFLGDPSKTDVITFEGKGQLDHAGEICVSADMAQTYATRHDVTFSEELSLYCVHGWLHLAGYDDLKPEKKKRMRAAEVRAMALLRKAKKLPKFSLR